jgi:ribosomal protein S17E
LRPVSTHLLKFYQDVIDKTDEHNKKYWSEMKNSDIFKTREKINLLKEI